MHFTILIIVSIFNLLRFDVEHVQLLLLKGGVDVERVESDISTPLWLVDMVSVIEDPTDNILLGEELFKELDCFADSLTVSGIYFKGFHHALREN